MGKRSIFKSVMCGFAILGLISSRSAGSIEIERKITAIEEDRLTIQIDWSFPFQPDACLIVEESIPEGWVLEGVESTNNETHTRKRDGVFSVAASIGSEIARSGRVEYWLAPENSGISETLQFGGRAYTMRDAEKLNLRIEGMESYAVGGESSRIEQETLHLTGFKKMDSAIGEGFVLYFSRTDSDETMRETDQIETTSHIPAGYTLKVDYKESLLEGADWQCIHTNQAEDRLDAPGQIEISEDCNPGFYRIRAVSD